jgi:centromeric protein E
MGEEKKEDDKPADAITVCVRIRPHDSNRDGECDGPSFDLPGNGVIMESTNTGKKAYNFDWVGHPSTMNPGMYKSCALRVVLAAMEGFNGTVFTYGQTGSGKTHSMMGTVEDPGVIRSSVITVFSYIDEHPDHEFLLRVSYIEVYNEEINDLLNFDPGRHIH